MTAGQEFTVQNEKKSAAIAAAFQIMANDNSRLSLNYVLWQVTLKIDILVMELARNDNLN